MDSSTSIKDLIQKKDSKENTNNLVDDILRELKTNPAQLPVEPFPYPTDTSARFVMEEPDVIPEKNKKTKTSTKDYLQKAYDILKLPLAILVTYFFVHNYFMYSNIAKLIPSYEDRGLFTHRFINCVLMLLFVVPAQYIMK